MAPAQCTRLRHRLRHGNLAASPAWGNIGHARCDHLVVRSWDHGEALQRFGEQQIGWTELFKTSGDIYFREAAQAAWSLVRANANAYAWMLSVAGARPANPDPGRGSDAAAAGKRAQRGRG
jgi:hypothetical protein